MATPDSAPSSVPALTRRRFLALGGLTAAAVAVDLTHAPGASAATAQLSLDFENGSLGAPITQHAGAALGRGYAHSGNLGCRLDPSTTAGRVAYLVVDRSGFALDQPYATFAMYFRLVTRPKATDTYMNLFEIGNTSTTTPKSQFTVFFRDDRLMCDFGYSETMDLGPVPTVGEWHLIQAVVHFGATRYTADVSLDGAPSKTLTSANNKTAQSVKILWIHYPGVAVDYTMDVDDVLMATSRSKPGFFLPVASGVAGSPAAFGESFEGGAVGTEPTTANTSYDQAIRDAGAGNGTVAAAFAADGVRGQCVRFRNTRIAADTYGFLRKQIGAQRVVHLRRYYKLDALPDHRTSVLRYTAGRSADGQVAGTNNGAFALGGAPQEYKFTLVNGETNATRSTATVPVREWFRVETKVDFTTSPGVQTVRLFLGANLHGTVPDETLTARLTGTYTDHVEDGILSNPNALVSVAIDEAAGGADWQGPAV